MLVRILYLPGQHLNLLLMKSHFTPDPPASFVQLVVGSVCGEGVAGPPVAAAGTSAGSAAASADRATLSFCTKTSETKGKILMFAGSNLIEKIRLLVVSSETIEASRLLLLKSW